MQPGKMTKIIDRKKYSTETATLLADDAYWDGHNFERRGRNTFLYRTPRGAYFVVNMTMWQGEQDDIEAVTLDDAIALYEGSLTEHHVDYETAFPTVTVEEA